MPFIHEYAPRPTVINYGMGRCFHQSAFLLPYSGQADLTASENLDLLEGNLRGDGRDGVADVPNYLWSDQLCISLLQGVASNASVVP